MVRGLPARHHVAVLLVAGGFLAFFSCLQLASCGDSEIAQPCSNIPPGGCPLSHGVACSDPSCDAIYACRENNVWQLQERCPPHEAGARVVEQLDANVAETAPVDTSINAPPGAFGGPGCATLQEPDCSLGLALSCGAGCCACEDLFVCNNGAWDLAGVCSDGGVDLGGL